MNSLFLNPAYNLHLDNEHWIGLESIYNLTNRPATPMKLHIRMENFAGIVKDAYYDTFRIEDEVCNTIKYQYLFLLGIINDIKSTLFLEVRAEIRKIFCLLFGANENFKKPF